MCPLANSSCQRFHLSRSHPRKQRLLYKGWIPGFLDLGEFVFVLLGSAQKEANLEPTRHISHQRKKTFVEIRQFPILGKGALLKSVQPQHFRDEIDYIFGERFFGGAEQM